MDNLTESCNEMDINGKFSTFGNLQECKVFNRFHEVGQTTAAFVIFEAKISATKAVQVNISLNL